MSAREVVSRTYLSDFHTARSIVVALPYLLKAPSVSRVRAHVAGRRTTSDALSVTRQSVAGASERTAVKGSLTSMSKPAVAPMPFVFRHHTDHVLQMEVGTCRGFVLSAGRVDAWC